MIVFPGNESLGERLARSISSEQAPLTVRRFPDEETYLRLDTPCRDRDVIVIASLDRPDGKILPLLFLADLVRELGAKRLIFVAPYLAYMRQDTRFNPGEAITSRSFAALLSSRADTLVTIDPHLHRYGNLSELYPIETRSIHSAPLVADWIRDNIGRPLLVGPDSESEQWVADIASRASAPYVVLEKVRLGDREVTVSVPDVDRWPDRRPVLVDDIISSAQTMIETVVRLRHADLAAPVCVAVHAVFAKDAYESLASAGAERIVTTNTIPHASNAIDVSESVGATLLELLE
jgi:ribose-phosphate pyrophosphokinase